MTDVADFLEHFGVKGMKWGQRKMERKDQKWTKKMDGSTGIALSTKQYIRVHNAAAVKANRVDVPRINNKPEYKNADFRNDSPLRQKYYTEHENAFNKRFDEALIAQHGTSPSGRKQIKIEDGVARIVDVKHADGDPKITLRLSEQGHILAFKIEDDTLEQSDLINDFLAHYGVKGMKWGVRRNRNANGLVSDESARAGELLKKVKKEGGVQALTNKELGDLTKRLQLERQYSQLNPPPPSVSKKIASFVADIGATTAKKAIADEAGRHVAALMSESSGSKKLEAKRAAATARAAAAAKAANN